MSTTLSVLSVRERAVWTHPTRASLPARPTLEQARLQRAKLSYKPCVGSPFARPLWRSGRFQRSLPLAALQSPAEPSLDSVGEPHKRKPVDDSILIQGTRELVHARIGLDSISTDSQPVLLQVLAGQVVTSRSGTTRSS